MIAIGWLYIVSQRYRSISVGKSIPHSGFSSNLASPEDTAFWSIVIASVYVIRLKTKNKNYVSDNDDNKFSYYTSIPEEV